MTRIDYIMAFLVAALAVVILVLSIIEGFVI